MKFIGVGEYEKVAEKLNGMFQQSGGEVHFCILSGIEMTAEEISSHILPYATELDTLFICTPDENGWRMNKSSLPFGEIKVNTRYSLGLHGQSDIPSILHNIASNTLDLYPAEGHEGSYLARPEYYNGILS